MLSNPISFEGDNVDGHNIRVLVKDPVLHITWDEGQYTSYAIYLETTHVAFEYPKTLVRRRYSEFVRLRKMLKEQHTTIAPPSLPSKSFFSDKFSAEFINERRKGLEDFLEKVLHTHLYLSNRGLHLFMQSNLCMEDIYSIVNGQGRKHSRSEPHLILCPCPVFEASRESFDSLNEECHSSLNSSPSDQLDVSTEYGSHDTHSHVSLGSRITICTPSLEVPQCSGGSTLSGIDEKDIVNIGSLDSDYSSTTGNGSPAWNKSPVSSGILHFRSSSQNSSVSSSPIRKKKVSFHSEVTVAHLLVE